MTLVSSDLKTRIAKPAKRAGRRSPGGTLREVVLDLAVRRETATMDDVVERRASKQRYVETERESGLAVGEEWIKEDADQLLRIAKAVEEARREIDVQTLQDLIDPEHKMDAGDWVRFWQDRGFSGVSEPSDVWVRAFADGAARLFQKARKHVI